MNKENQTNKENWEDEFDEEFKIGLITHFHSNVTIQEVKSFIHQALLSHTQAVEKRVREMKKDDKCNCSGVPYSHGLCKNNCNSKIKSDFRYGYNQAIDDILQALNKPNNEI